MGGRCGLRSNNMRPFDPPALDSPWMCGAGQIASFLWAKVSTFEKWRSFWDTTQNIDLRPGQFFKDLMSSMRLREKRKISSNIFRRFSIMRIKPKSNVWTPISGFRKVNSNPPPNILVDPGWTAFLPPSVPFFEGKSVFQKQNTQIVMFERQEALSLREPPSLYLPRTIFLSQRLCLKRWIIWGAPKGSKSIFFFSSLIFIFPFAVFLFTNIRNSLTCFTFFSSWIENCVWFKKKKKTRILKLHPFHWPVVSSWGP